MIYIEFFLSLGKQELGGESDNAKFTRMLPINSRRIDREFIE
jgi:hypothetical protein